MDENGNTTEHKFDISRDNVPRKGDTVVLDRYTKLEKMFGIVESVSWIYGKPEYVHVSLIDPSSENGVFRR